MEFMCLTVANILYIVVIRKCSIYKAVQLIEKFKVTGSIAFLWSHIIPHESVMKLLESYA